MSRIHSRRLGCKIRTMRKCQYNVLINKIECSLHNFTMYNIGNHDAVSYWFAEMASSLEASSFAYCFVNHLKEVLEKKTAHYSMVR